jgi:hypothetical protein
MVQSSPSRHAIAVAVLAPVEVSSYSKRIILFQPNPFRPTIATVAIQIGLPRDDPRITAMGPQGGNGSPDA